VRDKDVVETVGIYIGICSPKVENWGDAGLVSIFGQLILSGNQSPHRHFFQLPAAAIESNG